MAFVVFSTPVGYRLYDREKIEFSHCVKRNFKP